MLKLADFGLARIWDKNLHEDLSHQVSTRQYRAPELLFASRKYTSALDIWSAAVIMVELVTLRPLFPSSNDLDQMFKVFQLMGTPNSSRWPVRKSRIHAAFFVLKFTRVIYLLI
jgi:cell cycle related kinase